MASGAAALGDLGAAGASAGRPSGAKRKAPGRGKRGTGAKVNQFDAN